MNTFNIETDSSARATLFGEWTQKCIDEIRQIQTKLHNTLFLKIISGKLRIDDAEKLTEEALV